MLTDWINDFPLELRIFERLPNVRAEISIWTKMEGEKGPQICRSGKISKCGKCLVMWEIYQKNIFSLTPQRYKYCSRYVIIQSNNDFAIWNFDRLQKLPIPHELIQIGWMLFLYCQKMIVIGSACRIDFKCFELSWWLKCVAQSMANQHGHYSSEQLCAWL